jgi:hypothetical protein
MQVNSGRIVKKAIDRRPRRLQQQLCPEVGQRQRLWFLIQAGYELALHLDSCTEVLDECGFLPMGHCGVVNFLGIPYGLNAKDLEAFLRKNGARTRDFAGYQRGDGSEGALQLGHANLSNHVQMSADVLR